MILTFSCQITLLALHIIFAPLPLKHPSFPKLPLQIRNTKLKYNLFHRQIKMNRTIMSQPFNNQCSHYIETSRLICARNQLTGFYMMGTLVDKWLKKNYCLCSLYYWRLLSPLVFTVTSFEISLFQGAERQYQSFEKVQVNPISVSVFHFLLRHIQA